MDQAEEGKPMMAERGDAVRAVSRQRLDPTELKRLRLRSVSLPNGLSCDAMRCDAPVVGCSGGR